MADMSPLRQAFEFRLLAITDLIEAMPTDMDGLDHSEIARIREAADEAVRMMHKRMRNY